ncbi:DUF3592 domain-containing protein [Cytophaga sp. FL35]|uniref:DUF3592 domain-containing protein n=1 Tax=Cytophaga sp. FL35 TaxID=1904456 RepID=UPI001653C4BA|nr:DUF3592 domain-containing protein [Cytophaga sp. FL35]MBC7000888.1 hypothetical protein [Cytophaga sp. FL35]
MIKEKKRKYLVTSLLVGLVIFGLFINTRKKYLLNDGQVTVGVIKNFKFSYQNYMGTYKYTVDGIEYEGQWTGNYFECPDGTKGCVGKEFPVTYSTNDPGISEINLKQFENKKNLKPHFFLK